MKILVCFKAIADLDRLKNDDWPINPDNSIDVSSVKSVLSSYDQSALEYALKLADSAKALDFTTVLSALTIDDERADLFLKMLYALHYDNAIRIEKPCHLDLRFNPLAVAELINAYQQQIQQHDLIILGAQSDDGQNSQTPMLLAEKLGWPCITQVNVINPTNAPHCIEVTSIYDTMVVTQSVKLPIILAIASTSESSTLRIPTLKSKLAAAKKSIQNYTLEQLNQSEEQLNDNNDKTLQSLVYQPITKQCSVIEGKDAQHKAQIIYEKYLKQRIKP